MSTTPLIDERTARRPDWTGGRPIRLLDGQDWLFPFPGVALEAHEDDPSSPVMMPPLDLPAIQSLGDPALDPGRAAALTYESARALLLANYTLTDEQLAALLPSATDTTGPAASTAARIRRHLQTIAISVPPSAMARLAAMEVQIQDLRHRLAVIVGRDQGHALPLRTGR